MTASSLFRANVDIPSRPPITIRAGVNIPPPSASIFHRLQRRSSTAFSVEIPSPSAWTFHRLQRHLYVLCCGFLSSPSALTSDGRNANGHHCCRNWAFHRQRPHANKSQLLLLSPTPFLFFVVVVVVVVLVVVVFVFVVIVGPNLNSKFR